jgi:hypothetical protein
MVLPGEAAVLDYSADALIGNRSVRPKPVGFQNTGRGLSGLTEAVSTTLATTKNPLLNMKEAANWAALFAFVFNDGRQRTLALWRTHAPDHSSSA